MSRPKVGRQVMQTINKYKYINKHGHVFQKWGAFQDAHVSGIDKLDHGKIKN